MSVSRAKPARLARATEKRFAFYDLDGTLVDLNLVHATLFILANLGEWKNRVSYLLAFAARAPRLYRAEQRDRRLLNTVMFEAFRGVSHDRLLTLGEEYCDRVLRKHLYPHAVSMLHANHDAGIEPVIVTGSPDFVVAPIARELGVEHFAANRFVYRSGKATGRLVEPVMASDEKADWCAEFAAARGIDLRDCWGYADSHYDLAFLAALGHPVCVNPDRKLKSAAATRQWPIVYFDRAEPGGDDDIDSLWPHMGDPDGPS